MKTSFTATGSPKMDRLIRERIHDPYKPQHKLREPAVCPNCKAVFRNGRWQWAQTWPADAHEELCQACRRVKDHCPAGLVTLTGNSVVSRQSELLNLIHNVERMEKAEHPLQRIMDVETRADTIQVSTTDLHLARWIAEAIHHAGKGRLDWHYNKESCLVRINWTST